MRSEWVAASAAALVVGATALFFGAHMTPRVGGEGQLVRQAAGNPDAWTIPSLMLMLASVGLLFGISTFAPLLHPRGYGPGLAGMLSIALAAIVLAGFAMQLVLLRGLSIEGGVSAEQLAAAMGDRVQQGLLYVGFGAFFIGEILLAWALFLARTTPRWVPWMFLGHVVGAMLIRIVHVPQAEDLPAILMVAGFAGSAIAANRTDVGGRRPERVRTRPGHRPAT